MARMSGYQTAFKGLFWLCLACLFYLIIIIQNTVWALAVPIDSPVIVFQEILVQYRPEARFSDIANTYNKLGLNEVSFSPLSGFRRVRVPLNVSVYTVAAELAQNPLIAYAEPNYLRTVHFTPNDPLYLYQWHLNNPMMEKTWDLSIGSDVIVAVLDSGVAYRTGGGYVQAPDLANTNFMPGYDFINDDPYPDDDNRHGTHITGTIAQSINNLLGGAGVAPGCTIMPVKVLDETGYGDVAAIADGIYYAVNNGAQVINMSLGGTRPGKGPRKKSAAEEIAINYAVSQGVAVVCSAGNESTNLPSYPAAYDATISVTATTYDQSFASSYSNYGSSVDVCAPGGDLNEDLNEDGYPDGIYQQTHDGVDYTKFDFYFAEGTSSAAAFVTGVVALILAKSAQPLTPDDVREILHSTAIDLGDPGWDQFFGWGLVNPLAAVQVAVTFGLEGHFLPYSFNQFSNPSNGFVQIPLSVPQGNINPVLFQANANFAVPGQPTIGNNQLISIQQITPYERQNYFWLGTNGIVNPQPGNFLTSPYSYLPFRLTFDLFQVPLLNLRTDPYIPLLGEYRSEITGNFLPATIQPYPYSINQNSVFYPYISGLVNPFLLYCIYSY